MITNKTQTNSKLTNLEIKIASARRHLQFLWDTKGYTDSEVLSASIELDLLINEWERLFRKE